MDPSNLKKEYSNGEITIVWQSGLCIHSTKCWKGANGLPEVFNPREKPWIKPDAASSERIISQVNQCPSGALSFFYNSSKGGSSANNKTQTSALVEVSKNGPLLIHGEIQVMEKSGNIITKDKITAFCRCGASGNKPFCDGSHRKIDFKDE